MTGKSVSKGKRKASRQPAAIITAKHQDHNPEDLEISFKTSDSIPLQISISPQSSSIEPSIITTTPPSTSMVSHRQILLCSIGNPGKLLSTRHSAAHYLLPLLATSHLTRNASYNGLTAPGPSTSDYTTTLYQSPEYMNVSGCVVKNAWREFRRGLSTEDQDSAILIILHDELEKNFGEVKIKYTGSTSGHNGLTSIVNALGTKEFTRIGLGIGPRPESRDQDVVSRYVLHQMSIKERAALEEVALPVVLRMVEACGTGKNFSSGRKK